MDFILYKFGDSFVIDFNNLETNPQIGALDILGGMKTLLEDYLKRTNASAEQCLDITDRILGLIREHTEKRVMSLKRDEVINQMNSEIAKGKPVSEDEGDRRIALAEREARSWILEGKAPEAKFFDVIQDSKTVVVNPCPECKNQNIVCKSNEHGMYFYCFMCTCSSPSAPTVEEALNQWNALNRRGNR